MHASMSEPSSKPTLPPFYTFKSSAHFYSVKPFFLLDNTGLDGGLEKDVPHAPAVRATLLPSSGVPPSLRRWLCHSVFPPKLRLSFSHPSCLPSFPPRSSFSPCTALRRHPQAGRQPPQTNSSAVPLPSPPHSGLATDSLAACAKENSCINGYEVPNEIVSARVEIKVLISEVFPAAVFQLARSFVRSVPSSVSYRGVTRQRRRDGSRTDSGDKNLGICGDGRVSLVAGGGEAF